MAKNKEPKIITKRKRVKKLFRKALKPNNIGKALIIAATIALLATSIHPYLF
ncbi:hypothetical protein ACFL0C_01120 [Patescibacteria group bacterium]